MLQNGENDHFYERVMYKGWCVWERLFACERKEYCMRCARHLQNAEVVTKHKQMYFHKPQFWDLDTLVDENTFQHLMLYRDKFCTTTFQL